jgi:hypothetical protein
MPTALDLLESGIDAAAGVDLQALDPRELGADTLRMQRLFDRFTAVHALMVNASDKAGVWRDSGAKNVSDWLAGRTNTDTRDVRRRQKLGDTLDKHQKLADDVASGETSTAAADAIRDALDNAPEGADPDELFDQVKNTGPVEARKRAEEWRRQAATETPEEATQRRFRQRSVTIGDTTDGMVTIKATLPELEAKAFEKAICDASGGFADQDQRTLAQLLADGLINLTQLYARGSVTGGRKRPTIIATAELETLLGRNNADGLTADGLSIPADVLRQLAENADIQLLIKSGEQILYLGRSVRFGTDAQFNALLERDGGCRFPGCDAPAAACDIDHLDNWELGGNTDLDRLALWCFSHHMFRHRSDVKVIGTWDDLWLQFPDGTLIACPTKRQPLRAAA